MDILKNMQDLQGKMEVLNVAIAPEVVDPTDITMLEDLVLAAVNSTLRELQDALKNQATQLTGGLNLPGGFPGL